MNEAFVVASVEREGGDQARLWGRGEIGAGDVFDLDLGQKSLWDAMLAKDFASEAERGGALLVRGRFAGSHAKIAGLCVGGESTQLAANFQRTRVGQARDCGVAVFFAHLSFSDGGSAKEHGIFSARQQEACREIVWSLLAGEATGLHWRQDGIFRGGNRLDTKPAARLLLDS